MTHSKITRRSFVKRAAYVAPTILTLQAAPEFAKAGSVKPPPNELQGSNADVRRPARGPRDR